MCWSKRWWGSRNGRSATGVQSWKQGSFRLCIRHHPHRWRKSVQPLERQKLFAYLPTSAPWFATDLVSALACQKYTHVAIVHKKKPCSRQTFTRWLIVTTKEGTKLDVVAGTQKIDGFWSGMRKHTSRDRLQNRQEEKPDAK